tara:strand:- start:2060 stop:2572 length:513 start_codon:yes stop_codon:yes gene_type:complete
MNKQRLEQEQRLADGVPVYLAEAEQQIIGAMMVWLLPGDIDEIRQRTGLRSAWFRDYSLGHIWDAIVVSASMQKEKQVPIMPTLVSHVLHQSGKYDEIGGIEFLNRLIANVSQNFIQTSVEGIIFNINVMKDWIERRKDYQKGQELVKRAFSPTRDRPGALAMEVTVHEV